MNILEDSFVGFVNLDSRVDRRERMEQTLADVALNAQRIRGPLPDEWPGDSVGVEVMRRRTPGAIGCYMGQTSVMRTALAAGKHALVLEDDLVFCSDFQKRLQLISAFLDERAWDVFWFGGTFHVNPAVWWPIRDAKLTENPRFVRTFGAFSTHAYLVNQQSIESVLNSLNSWLPLSIGIDWSFIQMQPNLQTFAFVPGCVKQYDNKSDIGDGVTYFSGFAKLGAHWYQDRMEDFDPLTYEWAEVGVEA